MVIRLVCAVCGYEWEMSESNEAALRDYYCRANEPLPDGDATLDGLCLLHVNDDPDNFIRMKDLRQ